MKKIRICVLVMAVAAGVNGFATPQAPTAKGTAKKDSAAEQTREIYGKIQSIKGAVVTVQTRTGSVVQVDAKPAREAQRCAPLVVGRAIAVTGTVDKAGVLHAETLQRAKDSSILWPADR